MGLTVLDAGVVIALLDASDVHHAAALASVREAQEQGDVLMLPASAYAECLVAPSRRGAGAVAVVDALIDALPVRVEPADRSIAARAASLRAIHGPVLRLPDALVVATALVHGAERIITTDRGWPAVPISVEVLAAA
ncbi:MAG: PIN domain-containing protein [Chloroflexota bacterium]